jgi:predicted component of type VI protein secretion system
VLDVKLVVTQGKPLGKEISLRLPRFLIGRGSDCHLRPTSELVSRHHCAILVSDSEVRVCDLKSTNGTFVNGRRISSEVVLRNGDTLQVGPLAFRVLINIPSGGAAGPAPVSSRLVSEDATESQITDWLLSSEGTSSPTDNAVAEHPTRDLTVAGYGWPTEETAAERAEAQETVLNAPLVPSASAGAPDSSQQSEEKVVVVEGGMKIKLKGKKQKIEKTREETSQAAAEILRKMMERRPK